MTAATEASLRERTHYRVVSGALWVSPFYATEDLAMVAAKRAAEADRGTKFYVVRAVAVVGLPAPEPVVTWLR